MIVRKMQGKVNEITKVGFGLRNILVAIGQAYRFSLLNTFRIFDNKTFLGLMK